MPYFEVVETNIEQVLPYINHGTCVVLHHMNGCFHCEMFMPTWKKVCKFYTDKGYILISIEAGKNSLLPKNMQNVFAFPSLRAYNKTKAIEEFNDSRTYDAVAKFIETYGKVEVPPAGRKAKAASTGTKPKAKAAPAKAKAIAAAPRKKKPSTK